MDMGRFLPLVGVKMEPVMADSQHGRHCERMPVIGPIVYRLSLAYEPRLSIQG